MYLDLCGPGSSVGIATELRTGRSGIQSRWGRNFPPVQTGPGAHPASRKIGTGSFPRVMCGRGVLLSTHPLLVQRSWKSRAIPLPNLWACNVMNLPFYLGLQLSRYSDSLWNGRSGDRILVGARFSASV